MKTIAIILMLLLLNVLNAKSTSELEKVSLQLHWKYQFKFAGFIVAKEKGYYEDVGLDVEIKEYTKGMNIVEDVVSSKSTYGLYNSNILIEYLQNKSIVLISSYFKRSAQVIITAPDIKEPKDLVGKVMMAGNREDFDLSFRSLFELNDIDIKSINILKHTQNIDDFISGKVDAMTALISDQPHKLSMLGVEYNIINPSDFGSFNLGLELFTSNEEVLNHPKRVKNFKDASIRGWEYALSHKDEVTALIYEKYSNKTSLDSLQNEANEIEKLILPKTYDIGVVDINYLNKQYKVFKDIYQIKNAKLLEAFVYENGLSEQVYLTQEEQQYLKANKNIALCLHPNIFPIDGFVDGEHTGIMGDIYKEISKKLGVTFTAVVSKSYKELDRNINEKNCKLVSILPTKNKRESKLTMTKAFFRTYFTLVSNVSKSFVQNPMDLKDKKLLVRFNAHKNKILKFYPYLNIEVVSDIDTIMKKVLNNEVFAIVSVNESSDYLIDKYGYGKLKINGFLSKENLVSGSIGVQKNEIVLYNIMEKVLSSISKQKIDEITEDWRLTRYHTEIDYTLIWKILLTMGVIFLIMAYYQRKLKKANKQLAKTIDELIKKDELLTVQSKQAVMGEMISMIAHQWRQPLSTITLQISNLQINKMLNGKVDEEDIDTTLNEISNSIIYLSQTIDDFKTYFHPDRKTIMVEVHDLLNKVVSFALPRVKSDKIKLVVLDSQNIYIDTHVNELIQVVLNLVNNAIDALSIISKDDKTIKLSVTSTDTRVFLHVEDNAGGISDENMKKLFEPYFSTKGKNGTGLGLYMSQMIIQKQFAGDIEVETSSNGSNFIVNIPK